MVAQLAGRTLEIQKSPVHLRFGAEQEWTEFPVSSKGPSAKFNFEAEANQREWALSLRQRDVKWNNWVVKLNGAKIGVLQADERDLRILLAVAAGSVKSGENTLEIGAAGSSRLSDDIEVSEIALFSEPVSEFLSEGTVEVETEVAGSGDRVPVRITVVDVAGALVPLSALGNPEREAVRTGVIYTADGRTRFSLPFGTYEVFASRGWEYSAPSRRLSLTARKSRGHVKLRLRREVELREYVSCDTHVHTLELSGHGDASVRERILTAAGEGLDIIVATEHNQTADYSEALRRLGLGSFLSVVRGNEVTTELGHFNIFPLDAGAPAPVWKSVDWQTLQGSLSDGSRFRIVVQNHPRDVHSGYQPFNPVHHLSPAGENLIGRTFFSNAVEVINSGAMYSDVLQPVLDWLGLLNRGHRVSAIGASDTHTVDFVPIGQARTYIRKPSDDWRGKTEAVFDQLRRGENLVSYGLAARLRVIRSRGGDVEAEIEVHGPSWSTGDRVTIYADGSPVSHRAVGHAAKAGLKLRERVSLKLAPHDVTLVAVATGPGVRRPFWEVRKPYQPVSKDWTPRVVGVSSAVRVDIDGGGFVSPRDYARGLVQKHPAGPELVRALGGYDAAVAIQALTILAAEGRGPEQFEGAFAGGSAGVREAYNTFVGAWGKARR